MNGIVLLSDSILLNAYHQAIQLKLDREFIELLMAEINRRNIHVQT
ncbi:sporulation histidine kinase inhibitor Sda [Bacillus sp. B1-b2]|nr:sporulation histidine kinase inhibitor Sda [Bacillus sp. B1-b2]